MSDTAAPIRALYLDGDPDVAEAAATGLEREDERFHVRTAHRPEEGLAALADDGIDCIVADYEMPHQDGIEFLERVRETAPELPFILYTDEGSEDVASAAISAGVTDYLQKTGTSDQYAVLANRIREAVEGHRARHSVEGPQYRLRQRRYLLDAISTALPDYVFIYDEHGEYLDVITGWEGKEELYAPEELVGKTVDDVLPGDVADRIHEAIRETMETGELRTIEYPVETPGGTFWYEANLTPLAEAYQGRAAVVLVARDATERKERERTLRRLQERTGELIRASSPEAIASIAVATARDVLDLPLSGIHLVDEERQRLTPAAVTDDVREHLGREPVYDRSAPDRSADTYNWVVFERGETAVIDDTRDHDHLSAEQTPTRSGILHPLGEHGLFITSSPEPRAFDDGDVALTEILATVVTAALDRVERETVLRDRTRRLRAETERLEQFADMVSHDLRNPLEVANAGVELARADPDGDHLDTVEQAHRRMETLIEELLALARADDPVSEPESIPLAALVEECWATVETGEAKLVTDLDREVRADESRLKQLLENLVRNAVEHAGDGVTVTVGGMENGFFVEDDGPGVPPEDRERVFESGYSESADGTGFGLAIAEEIATAHGWEIRLSEGIEGGARFEITGIEGNTE